MQKRKTGLLMGIGIIALLFNISTAQAQGLAPVNSESGSILASLDPTDFETGEDSNPAEIKRIEKTATERQNIELQLDQLDINQANGSQSNFDKSDTIARNQDTAKNLVTIAKNMEMDRFMDHINPAQSGNRLLNENPELETPAMVMAGAVALWIGRPIKLLTADDFTLKSTVTAREGSAQLAWNTFLFSGELKYKQFEGLGVSLAHTFDPIQTTAHAYYQFLSQTFQTSLSKMILPMLDFTLRTGQDQITRQLEKVAVLSYKLFI